MVKNTLPVEAITDPRTFTDPAALHGLLARIRTTDPLPYIQEEGLLLALVLQSFSLLKVESLNME